MATLHDDDVESASAKAGASTGASFHLRTAAALCVAHANQISAGLTDCETRIQ